MVDDKIITQGMLVFLAVVDKFSNLRRIGAEASQDQYSLIEHIFIFSSNLSH